MSASHYRSKKSELSPYSQAQPGPVCNSHPKGTSPSSPTAAPSHSLYCQLSHLHLHLWPLLTIRRGRGRQGKPPTPLLAPFLETVPESHLTISTSLLLTPSPLHTPGYGKRQVPLSGCWVATAAVCLLLAGGCWPAVLPWGGGCFMRAQSPPQLPAGSCTFLRTE